MTSLIPRMTYPIPLWSHQREFLERFESRNYMGMFFEMGAGKTATAIHCLRLKCNQNKRILRTIIIAPLSTLEAWKREIAKHAPALAKSVCVLNGTGKDRIAQLTSAQHHIYITNHDAMSMPKVVAQLNKHDPLMHRETPWDFFILDESHRAKRPNGKRSNALISLASKATYRLILTGSPVLQSALDLWAQFRILSPTILGDNYFSYRARYFYDKNASMPPHKHFPDWRPVPGSENDLHGIIKQHSMIVKKKDVMDLPPIVRLSHYVSLNGELLRMYTEMEKHFTAFLDTQAAISADLAITKLLRLMQICNGIAVCDDETKTSRLIPCPKLAVLIDLLKDLCPANKVVVWANFRASIQQIADVCEDLSLRYVIIQGGQTAKERQAAIDGFKADDVSICIANQGAGGVGIDGLQVAKFMIYYSRNFNLEHDLQSEARLHRGGSEVHDKITRIDIVTKDTVEEEVVAALAAKLSVAEFILTLKRKRT